jgi:hypothetical protein
MQAYKIIIVETGFKPVSTLAMISPGSGLKPEVNLIRSIVKYYPEFLVAIPLYMYPNIFGIFSR